MGVDNVKKRLEQARQSLLDLSRRNRLLNFKPRGRTSLNIVDEIPSEVYRILVTNQETMQFLPLEESEHYRTTGSERNVENGEVEGEFDDSDELALFDLPENDESGALADRHTDRYLQTALTGDKLQTQLLYLSREAESALQERGCNVLYLAIGFLEWKDREDSNVVSRAPLILVPVELTRESAKKRFKLRLFDDEPLLNPSLVHLCRQKFGLALPEFAAEHDESIQQLFDGIQAVIAESPGWSLVPEMHLGLFSFAKILMYLDLDDKRWPEERPISAHPLLQSLLDQEHASGAPVDVLGPEEIDDKVPPHATFQVLDADSSQQSAILAAKRGVSMVIEGPPGTGKSQTITNIIAECLSEGRTVLFVAEKSAALDVVKRRLVQVGLGGFVTELHSRKASKKEFMDELRRSMAEEHTEPDRLELDAKSLAQSRDRLNQYVRTLHKRAPALDMSPFETISRCAALQHAPEAPFDLPDVGSWTPERLNEAKGIVATLSRAAEHVDNPLTHPWRGVGHRDVPLHLRQQVPHLLQGLEDSVQQSIAAAGRVASCLAADPPTNRQQCVDLIQDAQLIVGGSGIGPASLDDSAWDSVPPGLRELLSAGDRLQMLRAKLDGRWAHAAEDTDWAALAARRRSWSNHSFHWFLPQWWKDVWLIRRHRTKGHRCEEATLQADLAVLMEIRLTKQEILQGQDCWAARFGGLWQGVQSDWQKLRAYARTVLRLRQRILAHPSSRGELGAILVENPKKVLFVKSVNELVAKLKALKQAWGSFRDTLKIDGEQFLGVSPDLVPFELWLRRIREAGAAQESLLDWAAWLRARDAARSAGLEAFLGWAIENRERHGPPTWLDAFERQSMRLWMDRLARDNPIIRDFHGEDHVRFIDRFRQADRRWLEVSRSRLAAQIAAKRPRVGQSFGENSGLAILEAELRRKRRHKPIRKLLAGPAGRAIQRITPCFMMSPISVAQFLEPGALDFDVVIFDEASQVEWADGLGAIARGSQLLLVGDEKQLPPTNFFSTVVDTSSEEEASDEVALQDLESILAVGRTCLPVRTTLRWHYRSRHDSLINFSNAAFYDNHLRTFPSPSIERSELGLSFRHVPEGVYFRSKGQFNKVEAKAVAEAVIEHAKNCPQLSLGVGAFSKAQQNAIEDDVESMRRASTDPAVENFITQPREEPFFVKNLETIQGDERDVIYLSVGYGRDEAGRFTMNFGPLNKDTGWRRLNVLITRARRRCVVFSSVVSDDMRVEPGSPRGVHALKRYLKYAEEGTLPIEITPKGDFGSPFEESVFHALRDNGWEVHSQVGCAGFAIDLAVVDPQSPGRYLCGIECDGATYHSSATARDRDRLRQAVLEDLGWKIIRVWSTDWYHQPETSTVALLDEVSRLAGRRTASTATDQVRPGMRGDPVPITPVQLRPNAQEAESTRTRGSQQPVDGPPPGFAYYSRFNAKRRGNRKDLLGSSSERLAKLLGEIVDVEGPIHQDELLRIAASVYEARVTGSARKKLTEVLNLAVKKGLNRRGMFIWPQAMQRPPIRWRGTPDAITSAELIAIEEVAEAAALVVEHEFGLPRDDLPAAVIRAMGFRRMGAQLAELAEAGVRYAVENQLVVTDKNGLMTPGVRSTE